MTKVLTCNKYLLGIGPISKNLNACSQQIIINIMRQKYLKRLNYYENDIKRTSSYIITQCMKLLLLNVSKLLTECQSDRKTNQTKYYFLNIFCISCNIAEIFLRFYVLFCIFHWCGLIANEKAIHLSPNYMYLRIFLSCF